MDQIKQKPMKPVKPQLTEEQRRERAIKNQKELDAVIQNEINKLLPDKKYFNSFKI